MKAVNIQWDTDGDEILLAALPKEMKIPPEVVKALEEDEDAVSDYLSDQTGFCHFSFELKED